MSVNYLFADNDENALAKWNKGFAEGNFNSYGCFGTYSNRDNLTMYYLMPSGAGTDAVIKELNSKVNTVQVDVLYKKKLMSKVVKGSMYRNIIEDPAGTNYVLMGIKLNDKFRPLIKQALPLVFACFIRFTDPNYKPVTLKTMKQIMDYNNANNTNSATFYFKLNESIFSFMNDVDEMNKCFDTKTGPYPTFDYEKPNNIGTIPFVIGGYNPVGITTGRILQYTGQKLIYREEK